MVFQRVLSKVETRMTDTITATNAATPPSATVRLPTTPPSPVRAAGRTHERHPLAPAHPQGEAPQHAHITSRGGVDLGEVCDHEGVWCGRRCAERRVELLNGR